MLAVESPAPRTITSTYKCLTDEWMRVTQCRLRDLGMGNVNPEGWGMGRNPEGSKHSGGVVFRDPH